MFKAGDRVEVIDKNDSLFGEIFTIYRIEENAYGAALLRRSELAGDFAYKQDVRLVERAKGGSNTIKDKIVTVEKSYKIDFSEDDGRGLTLTLTEEKARQIRDELNELLGE